MTLVEEGEFVVRLTLTNVITFSPIERDTPLVDEDAVGNAYGTMPDEVWEQLRGEGWTIEANAERIS